MFAALVAAITVAYIRVAVLRLLAEKVSENGKTGISTVLAMAQ
jgi:hypothetical protein